MGSESVEEWLGRGDGVCAGECTMLRVHVRRV